jgi:hypothetical protein
MMLVVQAPLLLKHERPSILSVSTPGHPARPPTIYRAVSMCDSYMVISPALLRKILSSLSLRIEGRYILVPGLVH